MFSIHVYVVDVKSILSGYTYQVKLQESGIKFGGLAKKCAGIECKKIPFMFRAISTK